ncbi:hypothetical protein AgCh_005070 [Apium graveolens]
MLSLVDVSEKDLNHGLQEEQVVPARYRQEFLTIAWDPASRFMLFSLGAIFSIDRDLGGIFHTRVKENRYIASVAAMGPRKGGDPTAPSSTASLLRHS